MGQSVKEKNQKNKTSQIKFEKIILSITIIKILKINEKKNQLKWTKFRHLRWRYMNEQQVYRKVFSIINHQVSKSQTHNIIFYPSFNL